MYKKVLFGLSVGAVGGVVALVLATIALAQFAPVWDGAFEVTPPGTEAVSNGPARFWELKTAIRERLDVQHRFGTFTDFDDDGIHRNGSAWAWEVADCVAAGVDLAHEEGRICYQTSDQSLWVTNDNIVPGTPAWERAVALPENAIILWDQANGDEDCDGVTAAGTCPCGFTEVAAFNNLTIRGADVFGAPVNADIPDGPGVSCTGGAAPAGCGAPAGVTAYNDIIETNELATHDHTLDMDTNEVPTNFTYRGGAAAVGVVTTNTTGSDDEHYHPFRTVLFCRKT